MTRIKYTKYYAPMSDPIGVMELIFQTEWLMIGKVLYRATIYSDRYVIENTNGYHATQYLNNIRTMKAKVRNDLVGYGLKLDSEIRRR